MDSSLSKLFIPNDFFGNINIMKIFAKYKGFYYDIDCNRTKVFYTLILKIFKIELRLFMRFITQEEFMKFVEDNFKIPLLAIKITTVSHLNVKDAIVAKELGYDCKIRSTSVINLIKSFDEVLDDIDPKTKNQIRKAQKEGLTVSSDFNEEIFNCWWEIYTLTVFRGKFAPQKKEMVLELLKSGHAKLFHSSIEDKIIAGAVVLCNNYPIYWLGASDRIFSKYNAPSLLQLEIIKWAKEKKYLLYDLGGLSSDPNHGPTRFKKSFGGEEVVYYEYIISRYPRIVSIIGQIKTMFNK